MQIRYNVTGARRKEMVKVVSRALGDLGDIKYLGAPTFSYRVWCFEITRDGTLVFGDYTYPNIVNNVEDALEREGFKIQNDANSGIVEKVVDTLAKEGFECAKSQKEIAAINEPNDEEEPIGLSISLPRDSFTGEALKNLDGLLASKGNLIKKAFGVENIGYMAINDRITFPWFENTEINAETAKAFQDFVSKLCELARKQKRVTARPREYENEKYAFRCFLLRLGLIGDEYKTSRKILLKNLSGNSSWRDGRRLTVNDR